MFTVCCVKYSMRVNIINIGIKNFIILVSVPRWEDLMTAALIDVIQLCEFTINYDTVEHTHACARTCVAVGTYAYAHICVDTYT